MYILHLDLGRTMRGGQWQVFYLARHQQKEGRYLPVVACPAKSPLLAKLNKIGVETIALPSDKQWNLLTFLRLSLAQHKNKFSIIHTHDSRAASLGAMCHRLWGKKTLLVHTRRVSYPVKGLSLNKYKCADVIAAVSQDTADTLHSCGLPVEQLCVIHSGIDLTRYTPKQPPALTPAALAQHSPNDSTGLAGSTSFTGSANSPGSDERFVFVVVGALTPQKGHSVLIKAMSFLKHNHDLPPWEVRIIGDGPLFNDILHEAQALGVDGQLCLLGRQDASKLLPFCDAMIVPSIDGEGSSGTIKEAWGVGLPLICSDLKANLELAEHNKTALVFTCGIERDLASNMDRLIRDKALQQKLVAAGNEQVLNYTAEKMSESYTRLYDRILSFKS